LGSRKGEKREESVFNMRLLRGTRATRGGGREALRVVLEKGGGGKKVGANQRSALIGGREKRHIPPSFPTKKKRSPGHAQKTFLDQPPALRRSAWGGSGSRTSLSLLRKKEGEKGNLWGMVFQPTKKRGRKSSCLRGGKRKKKESPKPANS